MKHLISLSLKYVKRQKLRSFLTFCCIAISVFILSSVCAYSSSLFTTLKNQEIEEGGAWEVDLSTALERAKGGRNKDPRKIFGIIKDHACVSDYDFTSFKSVDNNIMPSGDFFTYYSDSDYNYYKCYMGYFKIAFDNNNPYNISEFRTYSVDGNKLRGGDDYTYDVKSLAHDEIVLEKWQADKYGYKVGDEIEITITPAYGKPYRDEELIEEVKKRVIEENKTSDVCTILDDVGTPEEFKAEGKEYREENHTTAYSMMCDELNISLYDYFVDEKTGEPYSVKLKIAGFRDDISTDSYRVCFSPFISVFTDIDFKKISDNYIEGYNKYISKETGIEYNQDSSICYLEENCYVRINENVDFNEGVEQIISDIGLDIGNFYSYGIRYNDSLLVFELRGNEVMASLVPFMLVGSVLLFIAWAISRFIIDNAFEISIQERNVQFAVLRTIGASKTQILTLIFVESLFYCVTAVPIGIAGAFLLCKAIFKKLYSVGFTAMEFSVMPLFWGLSVVLCVTAIFISAYTSALWASRKLSPSEAMNFGKPKRKSARFFKKLRRRKTVIDRKSTGFILNYTLKNILSKKSRFVISSIAMGLGVTFFTIAVMFVMFFRDDYNKIINIDRYDYMLTVGSAEDTDAFYEKFGDNDNFSAAIGRKQTVMSFDSDEELNKLREFAPNIKHNNIALKLIDRKEYDKKFLPLTSMSYDDFVASDGVIVGECPMDIDGYASFFDYEEPLEAETVKSYYYSSYYDKGYDTPPEITANEDDKIKLIGQICFEGARPQEAYIPYDSAEKYRINTYGFGYLCYLTVNGHENGYAALKEIKEFERDNNVIDFANNYMIGTGLKDFIRAIVGIVLTFILSVWLAGVFSMINTVNTSVLNRSRELKMVRAVGMTKRQLYGSIILESVLFSAVSTIFGILTGAALFTFMVREILVINDPIPMSGVIAAMVIMLAVNVIVAAVSSIPAINSLKKHFR